MAEYLVVVTLAAPHQYGDLDRELLLSGFDTTMEPSPATAFVLPRGVYRQFSDLPATDIRDAVAGHLSRLRLEGAVLVVELCDSPPAQVDHGRHNPNNPQPIR